MAINSFPKAKQYIESINIISSDPLDQMVHKLLADEADYERASQALRRRFSRGATVVDAKDRGGRETSIKREMNGKKFKYLIAGADGSWNEPDERIWVVAMYALWQKSRI